MQNTEIKEVTCAYLWEPLFSDPNKTLVERLKSKNCQFHLELLKYDFLTKKIVYFCYHISLTDAKKILLFNVFLFKDCFGDWFSHFHQWNCIGKKDLWMAPILKSKPFFSTTNNIQYNKWTAFCDDLMEKHPINNASWTAEFNLVHPPFAKTVNVPSPLICRPAIDLKWVYRYIQ